MPRGDRTGPMGAGPMTGRRAGYCTGNTMPGFAHPVAPRYGIGFRGGGRGWRNMFYATGMPGWQRLGYTVPSPQEEPELLKEQAKWLKEQLDIINKQIEDLNKK
ncbi:MAG: DUF5320 domain-containing protein [Anaerolineaceae bacterium]|nr:DUF5320 domain-containing protein [Anaerolineaceae bacterium]MBN2677566.1 DUF5320 domain-containing protein [Anaerolineaceae bacterium]